MSTSFKDQKVWIIGASSGIGYALALELAERGAILTLSARREEPLKELQDKIGAAHTIAVLDVTDVNSIQSYAHQYFDRVIFMAGHYHPSPLHLFNAEETDQIIDTNLKGAFNVVNVVYPVFKTKGKGQIALCGSVAGYRGLPYSQPYAATKAAIINLAESLRAEGMKHGVDVRLINPGFVRTPMTDKNIFRMPMMIKPEQAAKAIADGLAASKFEIHFPKKFTFLMKILSWLPDWLYFKMVSR